MFSVMTPQRAAKRTHSRSSQPTTTRTVAMTMVAMLLPRPLNRLWRSQPTTPTSVIGGPTSVLSCRVVSDAT